MCKPEKGLKSWFTVYGSGSSGGPNLIVKQTAACIVHTQNLVQTMEWPIARAITGDERVDIQILAHNRSALWLL